MTAVTMHGCGVLSLRTPVGARSELRAAGVPRFAPPLRRFLVPLFEGPFTR
jgi:hypothetical protein